MNPSLFDGAPGARLKWAVLFVIVLLGLFLLVQTVAGFQNLRYIGSGVAPTNTINVSGYGESFAVPDIATFSFSVVSEKSTVAAAQADATAKINAVTQYLKDAGIEEKDIKTSNYSVNPQYDYITQVCVSGMPCRQGEQKLRGYEVRQTTTVKVRDTEKAGDLLAGVGSKGATEVSGLDFTFDDPDAVQAAARDEAIADAKQKAETLAKSLGVQLVRVVSFNESGGYPGPIPYYAKDAAFGMGAENQTLASAPEISVGQNQVSSNVSVTYEIR
ncbi:SIMPL domain-containing protein [Acetobacteraceae bacterium]|nr:SIMPL domain-containing protein [Candidatus Parcubacteria bacterium]